MSDTKHFYNLGGSNYYQNYTQSARIQSFLNNHPQINSTIKYSKPIFPLNIATSTDYLIELTYTLNNNNSITFNGIIPKKNFQINGIDIFPYDNNYTVDYTYNKNNGSIQFTINNFNNVSCKVQINGTLKLASTTHYVYYYYNYLTN